MIFVGIPFLAGSRPVACGMATQLGDLRLQVVFSRAFLLELERGDLEMAAIFARAFLKQRVGSQTRT